MLAAGFLQLVLDVHQCIMAFLPVPRAQLGLAQRASGFLIGVLLLVEDAVTGLAGGPERVGFLLQGLERIAQMLDAGGSLKQHAADVVGSLQDALAAFHQRGMVQRVHAPELIGLQAAQPFVQGAVGQRFVGGCAQGVLLALAALEVQGPDLPVGGGLCFRAAGGGVLGGRMFFRGSCVVLDDTAQAKVLHRVQEVHAGAAHRKAEQPVGQGTAHRRLAGFIGTHDEMDVLRGIRQRQEPISEFAVAEQPQFTDAHEILRQVSEGMRTAPVRYDPPAVAGPAARVQRAVTGDPDAVPSARATGGVHRRAAFPGWPASH